MLQQVQGQLQAVMPLVKALVVRKEKAGAAAQSCSAVALADAADSAAASGIRAPDFVKSVIT